MAMLRPFVPVGQNRYRADYSSVFTVANYIIEKYLTVRRARFSRRRMSRIILGISIRRLQETSATQYAVAFDRMVSQNGYAVPAIVNNLTQSLPLNGTQQVGTQLMIVEPCPEDLKIAYQDLLSGQLANDFFALQQFAQASQVALVPIEMLPFIQPSITKRYNDADFDILNDHTVPNELIYKNTNNDRADIYSGHTLTDQENNSIYSFFDQATADSAYVRAYLPENIVNPDYTAWCDEHPNLVDVNADVLPANIPPKPPAVIPNPVRRPDNFDISTLPVAFHSQSLQVDIKTKSQAVCMIIPIFAVSNDIMQFDTLSIHTSAKAAFIPDDFNEIIGFVQASMSYLALDLVTAKQRQDTTFGSVKVQSREVTHPAFGISPPKPGQTSQHEAKSEADYSQDTLDPYYKANRLQGQLQQPNNQVSLSPAPTPRRGAGRPRLPNRRNVRTQSYNIVQIGNKLFQLVPFMY